MGGGQILTLRMKTMFGLALCLAGGAGLHGQDPTIRPSRIDNRSALDQVSRMQTDKRIETLQKSLKATPNNAQLQLALGSAFLQKMRETTDFVYLRRAAALDDSVLRADPESYEARRLSIEIDMHKHDFPQAAENAQLLLKANPADTGMLGLLGDALMEMGKCDEAGQIYNRMASLGGNLFSYNRLAFHQFVTGDMAGALAWMAQAVAAGSPSPENQAWVLTEMGDLLSKAGRVTDAEHAYGGALQAFSGYHRAHAGMGSLQASREDWSGATRSLEEAQAAVPFPQYAAMLEALYTKTGKLEAAARERVLVDAVDKLMASNGETANRALVIIYTDTGRNLPRALELAQAEFAVRNDVYTWDALSWALLKNKRVGEAREASAKALVYHTPDPLLYYHAGMIASAAGAKDDARLYLNKAITLNPALDFRYAPILKAELQRLSDTADGNAH